MPAGANERASTVHREFHVGRAQRLADNPRLVAACQNAATLLPIYDLDPAVVMSPHRAQFLLGSLRNLQKRLRERGSDLLIRLRVPDLDMLHLYRQSDTLYQPEDLPRRPELMPAVFTSFRREIERAATPWRMPLAEPTSLPPLPSGVVCPDIPTLQELGIEEVQYDDRSAFPFHQAEFAPCEASVNDHLEQYLSSRRIDSYKLTRNGLIGTEFSSKFSPWLALGNISARTIAEAVRNYEARYGANDGTYWLWFELLWRDFFALRASIDLAENVVPVQSGDSRFHAWTTGTTGNRFVDAGMTELASTGWLSNRMRQIVASYLIYELRCPWQWGEQWFAKHLVDYDPASNEGNWRYIAGQGADPRGGRRFDIAYQERTHDPDRAYTRLWGRS